MSRKILLKIGDLKSFLIFFSHNRGLCSLGLKGRDIPAQGNALGAGCEDC